MQNEIDRVNENIIKIRRLNIKIDIVNNHIKNLLEKTNINIRGFNKQMIDETINEITDNLDDLYIIRDEYKENIIKIENSYNDYYNYYNCKNIYECKYYIEKTSKV